MKKLLIKTVMVFLTFSSCCNTYDNQWKIDHVKKQLVFYYDIKTEDVKIGNNCPDGFWFGCDFSFYDSQGHKKSAIACCPHLLDAKCDIKILNAEK